MHKELSYKQLVQYLGFSLSVSYVAFLPQFYDMYVAENRFFVGWMRDDSLGLFTGIIVWACIIFSIIILVKRWMLNSRKKTLLAYIGAGMLLWSIAVRSGFSIFVRSAPDADVSVLLQRIDIKVLFYFVVPLMFLYCKREKFSFLVIALYKLVWPTWVLLFLQLIIWGGGAQGEARLALLPESKKGEGDILIFLFDEWSYCRTFDTNGNLLADMPNLSELLRDSLFYARAYAPGADSLYSITRFIYQDETSDDMSFDSLNGTWLTGYHKKAKTIFDVLDPNRERGRLAIGFGFNYDVMYSNHVDVTYSVGPCVGGMDIGYVGKAQLYLMSHLTWMNRLPLMSRTMRHALFRPVVKNYAYEVVSDFFSQALELEKGSLLGFFHFPLPHMPFVWREGRRAERLPADAGEPTVENYKQNLIALDHTLGELLDELKERGRYNNALIVVMSDHNWRFDPELGAEERVHYQGGLPGRYFDEKDKHRLKHVPLIVKKPGQVTGSVVYEDIYLVELGSQLFPAD